MKFSSLLFIFFCILLMSSCSRRSAEDIFKEGQAAQEQKNFQLAVERYQDVVDNYSKSAYAESSQYRIALIYNNDMHDIEKAVKAYQKFHTLFPESKDAPMSLFLAGFLLNNELHKYDSAKIAYETFLQKYPNHDLTASAKFELETLGKDPAQYLKLDVASKEETKRPKPQKASKQ